MTPPLYIERRFDSAQALCAVLARDYWGRAPVVFRGHGLGPVFGDHDDVLEGLQTMRTRGETPRVYADGQWAGVTEPCRAQERSVRAYVDRLQAEHGADEMLVVTDSFETTSHGVWFSCARFLGALYGAVGLPAGFAQVNVFAGAYRRTPFNFHKDVANSLSYALEGHKRYLIWDYDLVAQHLPLPADARHENIRYDAFDYTKIAHLAHVLETQPGDLVYWPWDCFHLAEPAEARFSLTISFGIAPFAAPLSDLPRLAKQHPCALRSEPLVAGAQPDPLAEELQTLRRLLDDEAVLAPLRQERLLRRTRFGFKRPLPAGPGASFEDDDRLVPPAANLIAWHRAAGRLTISVGGHGLSVDDDPALLALLALLNRGEALRVGSLRTGLCSHGGLDEDDLDVLLDCLARFHAFVHEPAHARRKPSPRPALPAALFERSGLFPLRLVDEGTTVLMAPMADEQHRELDGVELRATRVPVAQLLEHLAEHPPASPPRARYVLTAGYSGSTLLARCIDAMPGCLSLFEPRVLGDWSQHYGTLPDGPARHRSRDVLAMLVALLFRANTPGTRVVAKVGAFVQEVMEELLVDDARAVHLHTSLPAFLASTLGHDARRADLRAGALAPQRARMVRRIGGPHVDASSLSDARAIAYVWLTDRLLHGWLDPRLARGTLRAVDFDRWLLDPGAGLVAVADQLALDLPPAAASAIASGPLLQTHAKAAHERPFDKDVRREALVARARTHQAEIEDALSWAAATFGAAGLDEHPGPLLPLRGRCSSDAFSPLATSLRRAGPDSLGKPTHHAAR